MSAQYRKKPVVIEAVQLRGDNADEVLAFIRKTGAPFGMTGDYECDIRTLEGVMHANKGDWIIQGVQGEFYPCKPEIFDATYEPADES